MWEEIKKNRIFVGGYRKNGTTLLGAILDGHPDLFVYPYETHFWYSFYPIYAEGNYSIEEKISRVTNFIFGDLKQIIRKWIKLDESDLKFSYETLNTKFTELILKSQKTTKAFFDTLCYVVRELLPCPNYETHKIYVTKDTISELHVNTLFDLYPKAKFIHIMRDPRDTCAVVMNGWDKHYKYQYDSKERLFRDVIDRGWLSMRMGLDNQRVYGEERYLIIRYEDIVLKTEEILEEVVSFIGIDYDKLNIAPTFCGTPWEGNSFTDMKYQGVNTSRIGIFQKGLTEEQVKTLEFYFSEDMSQIGYNLEFERNKTLDAVREHYKWFNNNQLHSGKPYRQY